MAEGQAMRIVIDNCSRVPWHVAVLLVYLRIKGDTVKETERHVKIEKQQKGQEIIFTVRDER